METATEIVTRMGLAFGAELTVVRAEYGRLPLIQTQLLMGRTGQDNAQDAYAEEAKQRCRRRAWAATTSGSAA